MECNEIFWEASIEDIKKGYIENEEEICCLVCGESFTIGRIYEIDSKLYDAKAAAKMHIKEKHESMLDYLLNMNPIFTGISEAQKRIVELFAQGLSDSEISSKLSIANSTIRNHRYKLREREKQAKLFLAMMELLAQNTNKKVNKLDKGQICDPHKTATSIDDRFNVTDEEKKKIIASYIDETGALKNYPSKEKRKIIVLEAISLNFVKDKIYSEKEVNRVLKRIYEDYATLRRALIEYGFLDRSNDCKEYWVKM